MNTLLQAIAGNNFWKTLFYPLLELNREIECILLNHHRTRSYFKISIAIIASIVFAYYLFNNIATSQATQIITQILNFPKETEPFILKLTILISSTNIGMFIANITTNTFCQLRYGHAEFYLTPERLTILEAKFEKQLNHKITSENIKEVVSFCVDNFYKENSQELGGKKEDWRKTIESLIYDADLEHFFDQQKALMLKRKQLKMKSIEILSQGNISNQMYSSTNYGSMYGLNANRSNTQSFNDTSMIQDYETVTVTIPRTINKLRNKIPFSPRNQAVAHDMELIIPPEMQHYVRAQAKDETAPTSTLVQKHIESLENQLVTNKQMISRRASTNPLHARNHMYFKLNQTTLNLELPKSNNEQATSRSISQATLKLN